VKALVTGAGGFLGGAIARRLRARGDEVLSVSRGSHPALAANGIAHHALDLARPGSRLRELMQGVDAVFHCAARPGVWGPAESYLAPNLDGTQEVVSAAARAGVRALVHTSSPSVCFDGHSHRMARSLPLARRFLAAYPESKARAEELVLRGLGPDLPGTILRPHLLFGPGDPHLVPRLLQRARAGRLVQVGSADGTPTEVSLCFIDTAASAHLAAADQLLARGAEAPVAGRAYFLAQREPVDLWAWIQEVLDGVGAPGPRRRVSARAARILGAALEVAWRVAGRAEEPPLTRFVAAQLSTSHSYDLEPLEQALGWREEVGMAEATARTIAALRGA
jgi:nucleoside-diphosphate-sugar epimerase